MVEHIQKFRDQVSETDKALDLIPAPANLLSDLDEVPSVHKSERSP